MSNLLSWGNLSKFLLLRLLGWWRNLSYHLKFFIYRCTHLLWFEQIVLYIPWLEWSIEWSPSSLSCTHGHSHLHIGLHFIELNLQFFSWTLTLPWSTCHLRLSQSLILQNSCWLLPRLVGGCCLRFDHWEHLRETLSNSSDSVTWISEWHLLPWVKLSLLVSIHV